MYIQVHHKKIEYRGKVHFFPSYILESLHIKCHVSSLFCFNLDDYGLQLMEIKNPVSQNIRIKHLQYRNVDLRKALFS